jgi:8-oxo-dGTP diphosphatase
LKPDVRARIHVVAAAIADAAGRVLIAQRPNGKHMAGAWEFPGGKIEPGEAPLAALARELREELGIEIGPGPHRPVRRIKHSYPDRDVLIDVWRVDEFAGNPSGLDAQALRWCTPEQLEQAPLLPADGPILAALRLPSVLLQELTDEYSIGARVPTKQFGAWCEGADEALAAESDGADFVLLRSPMPESRLAELCRTLLIPLFSGEMSLHGAWSLGATGIHTLQASR